MLPPKSPRKLLLVSVLSMIILICLFIATLLALVVASLLFEDPSLPSSAPVVSKDQPVSHPPVNQTRVNKRRGIWERRSRQSLSIIVEEREQATSVNGSSCNSPSNDSGYGSGSEPSTPKTTRFPDSGLIILPADASSTHLVEDASEDSPSHSSPGYFGCPFERRNSESIGGEMFARMSPRYEDITNSSEKFFTEA